MTDNRFYKFGKINDDRWIECARWKNLVYARTLKCGSEFFYRNFTQTANWQKIKWGEIDWSTDLVFSYIMDPIHRRHKGIAEFIISVQAKSLLLENRQFQEVIAQVPCLDEHSACLRDIYGHRLYDIHWIPLDHNNHKQGQRLTNEFLEEHLHPPILWNDSFTHTTENYLKDIYNKIEELWKESPNIKDIVRNYFKDDITLYLDVQKKYGLIL